MPSYVVETYVPSGRPGEIDGMAQRIRIAVRTLAAEGRGIRFVRSTFLPTDEVCLLVFEAESSTVIAQAAARASVEVERIVEAVE